MKTKKGGASKLVERPNRQLCEVVGAGRWTVQLWRMVSSSRRVGYRLSLFLDGGKKRRMASVDFRPRDILDLPKLTQVVAASVVSDGWLPEGLRDDLACLASGLDWFLDHSSGEAERPWVAVRREALETVVSYLFDEERRHYFECAPAERKDHVFRSLRQLSRALEKMGGTETNAESPGEELLEKRSVC